MTHPKRRVFFSFHYDHDVWRTNEVRNAGVLEGNTLVTSNDWEQVKLGGDRAIQQWIDEQLASRTCLVVLVGTHTANRRWVNYEIDRAWQLGKGIVGVPIHRLLDSYKSPSLEGVNPFFGHTVCDIEGNLQHMHNVVRLDRPLAYDSRVVYHWIVTNLEEWVEDAIRIRSAYP